MVVVALDRLRPQERIPVGGVVQQAPLGAAGSSRLFAVNIATPEKCEVTTIMDELYGDERSDARPFGAAA